MGSFGSGSSMGQQRGIGNIERPMTASAQNAKVREVQEELKNEKKDKRRLMDQIEGLKNEIQKQNFSSFT